MTSIIDLWSKNNMKKTFLYRTAQENLSPTIAYFKNRLENEIQHVSSQTGVSPADLEIDPSQPLGQYAAEYFEATKDTAGRSQVYGGSGWVELALLYDNLMDHTDQVEEVLNNFVAQSDDPTHAKAFVDELLGASKTGK